jgi:hypothetical protein
MAEGEKLNCRVIYAASQQISITILAAFGVAQAPYRGESLGGIGMVPTPL